jgi:transcriptional regulator with XRE-family HTH domain
MTPIQCRMARTALAWSTNDLGRLAGVGPNTVNRFEGGQDARLSSVDKMRRALETAGVEFTNGDKPGVRLMGAWSVRVSTPNESGEPGAVKSLRHFASKEDAVSATRELLEAARSSGEKATYNHRIGFWCTAINDRSRDQTIKLSGPIGNSINELNLELGISLEQE